LTRERIASATFLSAALAWQTYAVVLAFRNAPVLRSLLAAIGGRLPSVTHNFFVAYSYWPVVPIVFGLLSADVIRRERAPLGYFAAVLVASVISALFLHAWLNEAWFRPLFVVLQKIG